MPGTTGLIYVADPMCSWCYGFGPQLELFRQTHPCPVRLVVGGLYVGSRALPLDDGLRAYLRETWTNVERLSGRPFSHDFLDRTDWTYDTELACRSVVAMRKLAPGHELRFMAALQEAFYRDGCDLTDEFTYPELLPGYPVDVAEFMLVLRSEDTREETRADFELASTMGFGGFPALVVDDVERIPLAVGYKPAAHLSRTFHVVAAPTADAVCTSGPPCGTRTS